MDGFAQFHHAYWKGLKEHTLPPLVRRTMFLIMGNRVSV